MAEIIDKNEKIRKKAQRYILIEHVLGCKLKQLSNKNHFSIQMWVFYGFEGLSQENYSYQPKNVFNTFADRMWLYAAGLLLMDAILKLNEEAVPIIVSSLYGLILNIVRLVTLTHFPYIILVT